MTPRIDEERADSASARSLVDELEAELAAVYPDESRHGYAVEKLLARGVKFFVIRVLRLETGVHQSDALALYERSGFRKVPPFPPYFEDPLSVCMAKDLVSELRP